MSQLFRLIALVLLPLLLFYVLIGDGFVANLVYRDSHVTFARTSATATSPEAIVFFTGAQSYGSALAAPMLSVWGQRGNVVVVNYPRHRFDGRTVIEDT